MFLKEFLNIQTFSFLRLCISNYSFSILCETVATEGLPLGTMIVRFKFDCMQESFLVPGYHSSLRVTKKFIFFLHTLDFFGFTFLKFSNCAC